MPDSAAPLAWPPILRALIAGSPLTEEQARWAMGTILAGNASDAQIAAFAMGLRAKGESPAEVRALVETMLEHARIVPTAQIGDGIVLDVVGTGGDHSNSVNVSTMSALVAAAAGAPVVKHGNRAASSATGAADVLEALGVALELTPDQVADCAAEVGIGFCFAPAHHPALRHAAQARRDMGVPTVFNILGPLTNPGLARASLAGCADLTRAPVVAEVLAARGVAALVVRGEDGLDEISLAAPTTVWDATGPQVIRTTLDPAEVGLPRREPSLLVGGDRDRNAHLLVLALDPAADPGPDAERVEAIRDAVRLNAAAALVAYEAARAGRPAASAPLAARVAAAMPRATQALESGAAIAVLHRWAELSSKLAAG